MAVKAYPNLDERFARRTVGRAARALSFAEKLEIWEELRASADRFRTIRDRDAAALAAQG